MKITIRHNERKDGNKSLYLDIYHKGTRIYERLNLYLVPEVDDNAKRVNENAMKRANQIRAERLLHPETINAGKNSQSRVGEFDNMKTLSEWMDAYIGLVEEGNFSRSIVLASKRICEMLTQYLETIHRPKMLLPNVDKEFIHKFLLWLKNDYKNNKEKKKKIGLSDGSLRQYQQRLNAMLNRAVREGVIKSNPFYSLEKNEVFSVPVTTRDFLTKEELQRFMAVKTDGKATQQAFVFSCFTGLRIGDIRTLKWSNIRKAGFGTVLSIRQEKTQELLTIPLGKMALEWLPERCETSTDNDFVFKLPTPTAVHTSILWIARKAGIDKHVSYHTSRHTFATLTLSACKDIKTVSKLMGHKNVATTQIYAEVLMDEKVSTVNHTNDQFGELTYKPKPVKARIDLEEPKDIKRRRDAKTKLERYEQYKEVIGWLRDGMTLKEAAERTGMGMTTMSRLRKQFIVYG
jgi:integrase